MMRLISLALLQSVFQVACQLLMKMALNQVGNFQWSCSWFIHLFTSLYMVGSGLCFAATSFCWMYILKHYPFSTAYPMLSIAYVIGMIAAMVFFHEQIPFTRWLGIAFIMVGCFLIAK